MKIAGKVKAHELRTKSKGELLTQLKELKEELSTVNHMTSTFDLLIRKLADILYLRHEETQYEILTFYYASSRLSFVLHK